MKRMHTIVNQTKLFTVLSVCIILLTVTVQTVQAELIPQRGPVPFHIYDVDGNGCISPQELARVQQSKMQNRQGMGRGRQQNRPGFEDFDKNADGYISEQELIEARSMRISERIQQGYQMRNTGNIAQFKTIDSNSDGQISREEFSQQQMKHQQQRQRAY